MSIEIFEKFSPDGSICALRDKAFLYVTKRVLNSFKLAADKRSKLKTKEDVVSYKEENRRILCKSLGNVPYDKNLPFNAKITGVIEESELIIEKLAFQSLENVYVSANLYKPKNAKETLPGIVFLCGHSANGKAEKSYQKAARIIAGSGFAVLVTEPEGQGERIGYISSPDAEPEVFGAVANHQRFGHQCFLNGQSPVKYFVAEAMRAYDYLESRSDIDSERIGITGNSGGGTLSSLTAAYDERFKAVAPSCWPTMGEDYFFIGTSPDSEQIWPGIYKDGFDHCELMSLICPRPLIFLTAAYDFVPIEGSKKLYNECKKIWDIAGKSENVEIIVSPNEHGYSEFQAENAARFFKKHLGKEDISISKDSIISLDDEKLNVCKTGYVKFDLNSEFVFDKNLEIFKNKNRLSLEQRNEILYSKVMQNRDLDFEINLRRFGFDEIDGLYGEYLMWFSGALLPNYAIIIKSVENKHKNIPVTICLWPEGTNNIYEKFTKIKEICTSGRAALILDVTANGKCKPIPLHSEDGDFKIIDKISKSLIQLGDSLPAIQSFDVLQAIRLLREQLNVVDISIYSKDEFSVVARICEMLVDNISVLCDSEITIKSIISNKMYKYDDTTQILMYGFGELIE